MPNRLETANVVILVKALPQPSKRYGETVCCAGVTRDRLWKRLFPVRFRHLEGESSFSRWDWVKFRYTRPTSDTRHESSHVHEESIAIDGKLDVRERASLLNPIIVPSTSHAMALKQSLALIRPSDTRFYAKSRSKDDIEAQREAFRRAARQALMFDKKLSEIEPSPYDFRFKFRDKDGYSHDCQNGDWETHTMFWRERRRTSEAEALKWMMATFNEKYPKRGMAFVMGNQAKRPQTWQLLGVLRLDETYQAELSF